MKKNAGNIRIGIDLDNTIISYDRAFRLGAIERGLVQKDYKLNKKSLRDLIRSRPNGEIEWQKLQGYIYGEGIHKAELFPGVYRFLWRCRERKICVEVVSHKTKFGHFDANKTSLRTAATNFLTEKGLIGNKNPLIKKVTFKSTRSEKIDFIKKNNYDYFIDDLEEIIFSKEFEDQNGILLSHNNLSSSDNKCVANSWEEISHILLGKLTEDEVGSIASLTIGNNPIANIEKLKGQGNSAIYKILSKKSKKFAMKIYPEGTSHNRLYSEFESSKIFNALKLKNVQRPHSSDSNLGVALYEWIEGERVDNYGKYELGAALSFLINLKEISSSEQFNNFPMASDACLSGSDIEFQVKRRLFQFENLSLNHTELENFLKKEFKPLFSEIISWSKASWPIGSKYEVSLKKNDLILSPSDFGFHNTIRDKKNNLIFHDFEYFGWDDPVKLICDFSHHAAMDLESEIEKLWFVKSSEIYGQHLLARLKALWPIYGLNWCLIILNEFRDDAWLRRSFADESKTYFRNEHMENQLKKSRLKLYELAENYKTKFFW